MKKWTEDELNALPVEDGFRLRGYLMTRLETLVDATFAFVITMLVISIGKIPGNLNELITALKTTPALLLAFAMIFLFWSNHRIWSLQFGLDTILSRFITFGLIFISSSFKFNFTTSSSFRIAGQKNFSNECLNS